MCYGTCGFENHMGDCQIFSFERIKELTGYDACFIGGNSSCEEENELFDEPSKNGEIDKMTDIILKHRMGLD